MTSPASHWFDLTHPEEILSPALLFCPHRIEANIRRMIELCGGPARLRPHVKTHKCGEIVKLQLRLGISKVKCATLAEAEMCGELGVPDVLLAYPAVGPVIDALISLSHHFVQTQFRTLVDNPDAARCLSERAVKARRTLSVLVDLDCGQHRTGLPPDPKAAELYRLIANLPGLEPAGLHAYDGHIHDSDPVARESACQRSFEPVLELKFTLEKAGLPVPELVAGGTPTFPFHARHTDRSCSPGTCVLWDAGYAHHFPDLDFACGAILLTRVISKPVPHTLCLDLGHKAVASEMPHPRVVFPQLPSPSFIAHSEEHLVVQSPLADQFKIGDVLYGIPWHVCPTVALHQQAHIIEDHQLRNSWSITARGRQLGHGTSPTSHASV